MIGIDAIDALFKRVIKYLGVELPERTKLRFEGDGVACFDDPVLEETCVIIPGGAGAIPDATTSAKGIVRLAGDMRGTAAAPLVAALSGDESGILAENHARALCDEPAALPHSRYLAGRFEQDVNNTTVDVTIMTLTGADACAIRVSAEIVAQDQYFPATSAYSATPVATFTWSGSTLTRLGDGADPLPVTATFSGSSEWIVDGSSIKLRLASSGNARFGGEYRLARIR